MHPLQILLLATDRAAEHHRVAARARVDPNRIPPPRRPLAWPGALATRATRLVARARAVAAVVPVLQLTF